MNDDKPQTNTSSVEDTAPTSVNDELNNRIAELEQKLQEAENKRLLLMADFDNYRKRMDEKQATFGAISNMALITELLQIGDDLEFALQDENLDLAAAKTSIKSAQDKLYAAASHAGVERLTVNVGDDFNKETMEAISTVANAEKAGKVVAVIGSGYKYVGKDGILRPAKVIVGK